VSIEVRSVTKRFGAFAALKDVSLEVETGELVALLGPSGSGKTSLLRIIAGLEAPSSGEVAFTGEDASGAVGRAGQVGFVFQHYALFRHMTVFENVAFGLRARPRATRPSRAEIRRRVEDLLDLVQLRWLADRFPSQLSGGQRQRVALARALAVEPRILLLDEPFGSLDSKVRQDLRRWLRRLHDTIRLTTLLVTHDQEEALEVSDRVVVMNRGRVEQVGTPEEVFEQPATPFVMNFLGAVNIFQGRVEAGRALLGPLAVDCPEHPEDEPRAAEGYSRPHELEVQREEGAGGGLWATLSHVRAAGPLVKLELLDEQQGLLRVETSPDHFQALGPRPGDRLYVRPRRVRVFVDHQSLLYLK
jgi:sulfate transport system ATP-binding protein